MNRKKVNTAWKHDLYAPQKDEYNEPLEHEDRNNTSRHKPKY
jgi:hypothetical protein